MNHELPQFSQYQNLIIQSVNVWLDVLDTDANVVLWNKAAEAISGYSAEEVVGHKKIWEWLYPDENYRKVVLGDAFTIIQNMVEEKSIETTIVTKSGEERIISWNSQTLNGDNGEPIGSVAIGIDITQQYHVNKRLRQSEANLRAVFENTQQGAILLNRDGIIQTINKSAQMISELIFDIPVKEGDALFSVYPKRFSDHFIDGFQQALSGKSEKLERSMITSEGQRIFIIHFSPVNSEERITGVFIQVEDITEQRRTEFELREKNEDDALLNRLNDAANRGLRTSELIRFAASEIQNAFSMHEVSLSLVNAPKRLFKLQAFKPGLRKVLTWLNNHFALENSNDHFIHVIEEGFYQQLIEQKSVILMKTLDDIQKFLGMFVKDAKMHEALDQLFCDLNIRSIALVPLIIDDQVVGVINVGSQIGMTHHELDRLQNIANYFTTILKRRWAEDALRESEARFRFTLDQSAVMVFNHDRDLRYVWGYNILPDFPLKNVIGKRDDELFSSEDAESLMRLKRQVLETGIPKRTIVKLTLSGEPVSFDMSIEPKRDENGEISGLNCSALEVTDRVLVEEKIHQRVEQLRALRRIDEAINTSLDLKFTLGILLSQVTDQLFMDAADVLLFDKTMLTLNYAAGRGLRSYDLETIALRLGHGYAGRAAFERRPVTIPDLEKETMNFSRRLVLEEGFHFYYAMPLIAKGELKGVLEVFKRTEFSPDEDWVEFLLALTSQTAIAVDNIQQYASLQQLNLELALAYDTTLEGWARALELRDQETEGHSRRVIEMTMRMAKEMGFSDEEMIHIRRGTLLHDIGKMGIPDSILFKPGALSNEEWQIMRSHPVMAYRLLIEIPFLQSAIDIPYCHHERWDGSGYPQGLVGEKIPLSARIFAVVDVWDALLSDRPYRPAWTRERTLAYIREQAGRQFDPKVVEVFLQLAA
jgi:PAS domain S-box-containing protein